MLFKHDLVFQHADLTIDELAERIDHHLALGNTGQPPQDDREASIRMGHMFQAGMLILALKSRLGPQWRSFFMSFSAAERKSFKRMMQSCEEMGNEEHSKVVGGDGTAEHRDEDKYTSPIPFVKPGRRDRSNAN